MVGKDETKLVVRLLTSDKTEVEAIQQLIWNIGVYRIRVLGRLRKTPTQVVRNRLLAFKSSWKHFSGESFSDDPQLISRRVNSKQILCDGAYQPSWYLSRGLERRIGPRHNWRYDRFEPFSREQLWYCFDCGLKVTRNRHGIIRIETPLFQRTNNQWAAGP